jgi:hypothetical protein
MPVWDKELKNHRPRTDDMCKDPYPYEMLMSPY